MGLPKEAIILKSGIPMIEHVYNTLSSFCTKIVLVGSSSSLPISLKGLEEISDNYYDIGPIGGLEALLSSGIDHEYLTVPCDLDQLSSEVLKILLEADGRLPIVFRNDNHLEPLIGRYTASILPIVRGKIIDNVYSLNAVLSDTGYTDITVPKNLSVALNNANTIGDFK